MERDNEKMEEALQEFLEIEGHEDRVDWKKLIIGSLAFSVILMILSLMLLFCDIGPLFTGGPFLNWKYVLGLLVIVFIFSLGFFTAIAKIDGKKF